MQLARNHRLAVALAAATLLGALVYVAALTSLPLQFARVLTTHVALSVTVVVLTLLVAVAAGCVAYGVVSERSLGQNGKLHDLGR